MKNKKTIWDDLLLLLLIATLIAATSCSYEPYESYEDIKETKLDDYSKSWDIIRNYPSEVFNFYDFGYYSDDCFFDTTAVIADFNLDGKNDFILSPQCSDDDQRQPPISIFYYEDGSYTGKVVSEVGPMAGARTTIVGDYNGDKIPDVFFIAHNGHGYEGGVPSILLSNGSDFYLEDLNLEMKWYSDGTSGDIDNDGDLDIIFGGNVQGLLLNDGYGNFTLNADYINNFNGNAGKPSLADLNNDGFLDLVYRDYNNHRIVFNSNGIFDYNNSIELIMPEYFKNSEVVDLDIDDRLLVDYDNDGDLDIIAIALPHEPRFGKFSLIQVLRHDSGNNFTDVSDEILPETVIPYTLQWLRANDLDKNGNIEIFENQKLDNWFNIEYNGSKFINK